jgi:hypothetical protein
MADAPLDRIISALEQAKLKLAEAQRHLLAAATDVGKMENAVSHTLGRAGRGSPVVSMIGSASRTFAQRGAAINGLMAEVDKAIGQARGARAGTAAGGG